MAVNHEVVKLWVDCDLDHEGTDWRARRLYHTDGREFTSAEFDLYFSATAEDIEAAADVCRAMADDAARMAAHYLRVGHAPEN